MTTMSALFDECRTRAAEIDRLKSLVDRWRKLAIVGWGSTLIFFALAMAPVHR